MKLEKTSFALFFHLFAVRPLEIRFFMNFTETMDFFHVKKSMLIIESRYFYSKQANRISSFGIKMFQTFSFTCNTNLQAIILT